MADLNDLDAYKFGAMVPVTSEMLADAYMAGGVWALRAEPGSRPDRNPMPTFVLFPFVARWQERIALVRQRVKDVAEVARNGYPEHEDDPW